MQRARQTQQRRPRRALWLALAGVAVVAAIAGTIALTTRDRSVGIGASKMPCVYNDSIAAFGENLLYYDGVSIHCISPTGSVRWSFQIGADAGFSANEQIVVAWAGNTIYILDRNGNSSYNDNLGETIQFARAGTQYIGAVIGDVTSPRLVVKDHTGAHMDEEADAYRDLILLDVGFYGKNGEYMWTLALDVFGTASNTLLNTYEVGKMNTGEVSLGEPITYGVLYENSRLRVIGTRNMKSYNYRGTEDTTLNALVYGWRMIDSAIPERGDAQMLFAPTTQTENQYDIRELRVISGTSDTRYTLPDTCLGAAVYNRGVYALSATQLYYAAPGDRRFTAYPLPIGEAQATRYITRLNGGRIVLASGDDVYVVTLPRN